MSDSKARRRRHDAQLKERVLSECAEPDASVAKIALEHGLNANLVHKWRRLAARERCEAAAPTPAREFVALALPPSAPAPAADIRIELRRGALAVSVSWPVTALPECAAWLRELLR